MYKCMRRHSRRRESLVRLTCRASLPLAVCHERSPKWKSHIAASFFMWKKIYIWTQKGYLSIFISHHDKQQHFKMFFSNSLLLFCVIVVLLLSAPLPFVPLHEFVEQSLLPTLMQQIQIIHMHRTAFIILSLPQSCFHVGMISPEFTVILGHIWEDFHSLPEKWGLLKRLGANKVHLSWLHFLTSVHVKGKCSRIKWRNTSRTEKPRFVKKLYTGGNFVLAVTSRRKK